MLELRGVSKRYEDEAALSGIDLELEPGKTTVLIGPSGCGKSTLLRVLVGLVTPDEGEVRFEGKTLASEDFAGLRRRIGYVIQEGGLFPHLTARGNLELAARYFGSPASELGARVDELVELTSFPSDALDRYPTEISGAQRQRVSLMRALVLDPDLLLLDEPLGALDPMIRAELQEDLGRIFRELEKTVVLVTHDLSEARHFGARIVLIGEGRIVQQGSFEELSTEPANEFVEAFLRAQHAAPLGVDD